MSGLYRTIYEIKQANEARRCYWFSPSTMAFFNSVIESDVIGGRFFITSDRREPDMPKLYTVRRANYDGTIDTVGEFQGYATLTEARAAALIAAQDNATEGAKNE